MDDIVVCSYCGKEVKRSELFLTYDCHGIPYRYVCGNCYDILMRNAEFDGEYYTELDEDIWGD